MDCPDFEILIDEIGHKKVHFKCCDVFAEKRCKCKIKECKHFITENGFTRESEERILKESKDTEGRKSHNSVQEMWEDIKNGEE